MWWGSRVRLIPVLVIAALLFSGSAHGSEPVINDSESAAHGFEAAECQVLDTYEYPGFKLVQFDLAVLSHFSYMLVSEGQALVVDPIRDPFSYLNYAMKQDLKIVGVYLTHNNADFVAGHIELSDLTGCPIYISEKSGAGFKNTPLKHGSKIYMGQAVLTIWETPGHTPESTCGLLSAKSAPDKTLALISGDTLFVGSVGRPDLMGGQTAASTLASMMFDTWTDKLSTLPDGVAVYPAHGAGSLCGVHLSDEPTTTIGAQRRSNPYLQHKTRGAFIAAILEGLPDAPQYFRHDAALNKEGPEKVDWSAPLPEVKAIHEELANDRRYYVVDLRDAKEYALGHIPNSVNIALRGRFETWVGIIVPWTAKLILCGGDTELKEAVQRLYRVGYKPKTVAWEAWKESHLPVVKSNLIKPRELHQRMRSENSPVVVDVRLPNEWMGLRIGTVLNLPLNKLDEESSKLDPDQPIVAVCNSAYRSSLAMGILERKGFENVSSLDGGSQAWIAAGLPVYRSETGGEASSAPKRNLPLPERISAQSLYIKVKDLPGTFELVDIRPPDEFADYHIPGSTNRDISEVMTNPAFLAGDVPLIIVDRDGSLAMAVGGVLSRQTKRPIQVLHGGLEAYWRDTVLAPAVKAAPLTPGAAETGPPETGTAPMPVPPDQTESPQKPKRKSAGC